MRPQRLLVAGVSGAVVLAVSVALAGSSAVPGSRVGEDARSIGPNDLKPSECAAMSLTATVTGSGTVSGGAASELVLGSDVADTISAGAGDDCVVAGAGADILDGGLSTDVCLGGADVDTFLGCETEAQ